MTYRTQSSNGLLRLVGTHDRRVEIHLCDYHIKEEPIHSYTIKYSGDISKIKRDIQKLFPFLDEGLDSLSEAIVNRWSFEYPISPSEYLVINSKCKSDDSN